MTKKDLDGMAYAIRTTKKKKGANKGYKYTYVTVWSGAMTRAEYISKLAEIDRKECGLFLCKVEQNEMVSDRWWEGTTYETEAIRAYRDRIKSIRVQYGLSKSDVSDYMRV